MTPAQILRVMKVYDTKLKELADSFSAAHSIISRTPGQVAYLQNMLSRFPDVVEQREKAMRWLCFMQGVLWSNGIFGVEELKEHNSKSASKKDVELAYKGHSLGQDRPCAKCGDLDGCHMWGEYWEANKD